MREERREDEGRIGLIMMMNTIKHAVDVAADR